MARRAELFAELQPLVTTFDEHPWAWARQEEGVRTPRNAEGSRWQAGKDLSFVPLRPELVVEVRYDHLEGIRFRHTAAFSRWRSPATISGRSVRQSSSRRPDDARSRIRRGPPSQRTRWRPRALSSSRAAARSTESSPFDTTATPSGSRSPRAVAAAVVVTRIV